MEKKTGFINGTLHVFYALSYSLQGIVTGLRISLAIRQEFFILFLLCILAWYTEKAFIGVALSICGWLMVIVAELFNSAIEEALDLITHEYSIKVKAAKDMGSAAVFILVIVNIFGQALVYSPELWDLFQYIQYYIR